MNVKNEIKSEIKDCLKDAVPLLDYCREKMKKEDREKFSLRISYQKWYSKSLKILDYLAKDRLPEFKSYYEIDPKRKSMGYGSYYIQDYFKDLAPNNFNHPNFNSLQETFTNIYNQYTILVSIAGRLDSVLSDIQSNLFIELQDVELQTAKELLKINIRASGVIVGVVLEKYLAKVTENHSLSSIIKKKNPTISDFNEILKNNEIYDITSWRKISYLGDIRNLCAHNKEKEPTKEQVEELLDGAHWVTKNIF